MLKSRRFAQVREVAMVLVFSLGLVPSLGSAQYSQVGGTTALAFDGVDDYVTLRNYPGLCLSGDFTVSAWVKPRENTAGIYLGILGKMSVRSGYKGFCLARDGENKFRFWVGTGLMLSGWESEATYTESEWHHVAGVLKDGYMHIYVDGVGRRGGRSGLEVVDSGVAACVGQECIQEDYEFFDGWIDEVCFYDRALSDGEIETALSARPSLSDSALVGYWDFDETDGQIVWNKARPGELGYLGYSLSQDASDPQRTSSSDSQDTRDRPWRHLLTFDTPDDMVYVTTNNQEHVYGGAWPVQRVTDRLPDRNGMLLLQNLTDRGTTSPTKDHVIPAVATFTFEGELPPTHLGVTISFDCLFQSPGGTLRVRRTGRAGDTYATSVVAPAPGSKGGQGSMTWASYSSVLFITDVHDRSIGQLTLELRGPAGTAVLINNFSLAGWVPPDPTTVKPTPPKIHVITEEIECSIRCGDIAGADQIIDSADYLASVYCCPAIVPKEKWCADGEFTPDGFMSAEDVEYFAWLNVYPPICSGGTLSASAAGMLAGAAPNSSGDILKAPLLIAGKVYQCNPFMAEHQFLSDGVFGFDFRGNVAGGPFHHGTARLSTRLVQGPRGELYQLDVREGLIRLSTGEPVLRWGRLLYGTSRVDVGWIEARHSEVYQTPPIQDAAFDSSGDLYVVPVSVISPAGAVRRAAARIRLGASPDTAKVVQLYGESDLYPTGVCEIELDDSQNVYVLDKRKWEDAVLRRYDRNSGSQTKSQELRQLIGGFPIPTAFHVRPGGSEIVIADFKSLVFLRSSDFGKIKDLEIPDVNYITDMTEDSSGTIWVTGFYFAEEIPVRDVRSGATMNYPPYFKAFLAEVPPWSTGPIAATCLSAYMEDGAEYLSFPFSIVCTQAR